jgi:protocatechuate 3,4-dioxygenase beta subunit
MPPLLSNSHQPLEKTSIRIQTAKRKHGESYILVNQNFAYTKIKVLITNGNSDYMTGRLSLMISQATFRQAKFTLYVNYCFSRLEQLIFGENRVMKLTYIYPLILILSQTGCAQNNSSSRTINHPSPNEIKVGGGCEGCEGIYESKVLFKQLNEVDTLPDFNEQGPKIEISGTIFLQDGKTPAKDVILYIYHTDQKGLYSGKGNETGWGKKHGYIRGWIKTDVNGYYKFYTLVPASYPESNNPKHIHPTIKEPGKSAYWIDDFVFDDDPLLSTKVKTKANPVGGNGVLKTVMKVGLLKATRDIILGLHVSDYPKE